MIDLILSALGGATVALAVVTYIGRTFIKHQTDKALARHTQALTIEKEHLGHELAVEFHQKSLRVSRQEQDRVEALKSLYKVVVNLGDALGKLRSYANINKSQNFKVAYFNGLAGMFRQLSTVFNDISEGYRTLELQSVYIEETTEQEIKKMLDDINNYYAQALTRSNDILAQAQDLKETLSEDNQPKELVSLWQEMVDNWIQRVDPGKKILQTAVRESLSA